MDQNSFKILLLLGLYFFNESADYALALLKRPCAYLDYFLSVIEIVLISSYFFGEWKIKHTGFWLLIIALLSVAISFAGHNVEVIGTDTNYQLLFNSFLTAAMCLYTLYRTMINTKIISILNNTGFLITSSFLILASGEYFFWGIGLILIYANYHGRDGLHVYHITLNILCTLLIIYSFMRPITNEIKDEN